MSIFGLKESPFIKWGRAVMVAELMETVQRSNKPIQFLVSPEPN
jgi:hypothetical protein